MYNGIGLVTPRGSGTNGYVVRNLSHLRVRDPMSERAADFDRGAPSLREPDQGILDHERKRKVELRCLELQLELEDNEVPEDEITSQVDALRSRLLENLSSVLLPTGKDLKSSDTHGIAAAKKNELSKMARALGTSATYVEGAAFDREKQEEEKKQRAQERMAKDAQREEAAAQREAVRHKLEAEKKERDRLRRREEDKRRREKEARDKEYEASRGRAGPALLPKSPRRPRSPSPSTRRGIYNRSRSPASRRRGSRSASPPRRRQTSYSRSPRDRGPARSDYPSRRYLAPPSRPARRSPSLGPPRRRRTSQSPPRRTAVRASPPPRSRASPSPPPRRRGVSPSPPRRERASPNSPRRSRASPSPPPRRARANSNSSMSMSSGSSRSMSKN